MMNKMFASNRRRNRHFMDDDNNGKSDIFCQLLASKLHFTVIIFFAVEQIIDIPDLDETGGAGEEDITTQGANLFAVGPIFSLARCQLF